MKKGDFPSIPPMMRRRARATTREGGREGKGSLAVLGKGQRKTG